jgi:hypothetical protein
MNTNVMDFDKQSLKIYQQNLAIGWWDDPNRCIYQSLQLVSTEIAEATEGERKNLADDHLTHRMMGEVELADALIRVLDLGGRYHWVYLPKARIPGQLKPTHVKYVRSIAGRHMFINLCLTDLVRNLPRYSPVPTEATHYFYSRLINAILQVAETQGYDIIGAMNEKIEYNKHRADHKRENRDKEGGKAF